MKQSNKSYDLIVAGGGLSGIAAAVAAAREKAKVLIIEKHGFLGGMATAALVNPFMPYWTWTGSWQYDTENPVNQGIFSDILTRLNELDGLHKNKQTFNEEILKLVLDKIIKEYNIDILFHSFISGANRTSDILNSVIVTNKSGITHYKSRYFIDATGDADLSALANCEYNIGRDKDSLCQPMTLCFRLSDIDMSKFDGNTINEKFKKAKENNLIKNPREDVLTFEHMSNGVLHFNSTRIINKSPINTEDLTIAEMEAREQVYELYTFMKHNAPGFENCRLLMSAPQIGIRESRRIVGEYTITKEDLLVAKKFEDSIARGTYPVDIHNPSGTGTVIQDIPYGDYYTIPYRALIPKGIKNLIVAGRPISSTHEAHSAYRVMPICTSIGEAAGIASGIALKDNIPYLEVKHEEIHAQMNEYGALY